MRHVRRRCHSRHGHENGCGKGLEVDGGADELPAAANDLGGGLWWPGCYRRRPRRVEAVEAANDGKERDCDREENETGRGHYYGVS